MSLILFVIISREKEGIVRWRGSARMEGKGETGTSLTFLMILLIQIYQGLITALIKDKTV